jgi:acyl-coenzyme A synthetase/AMP-(fatty) acid ligase
MSLAIHNIVQVAGSRQTWKDRVADVTRRHGQLLPILLAKRVLFLVDGSLEAVDAFTLGRQCELDFGILETQRLSPDLVTLVDKLGMARVCLGEGFIENADTAQERKSNRISVMTSGTTGLPKVVEHSWDTLNTLVRVRDNRPRFWFVPYQPGSYAWYQMLCLGAFNAGQDLFCGSSSQPVDSFSEALASGVTAVSSTPTFWRYAFLNLDPDLIQSSSIETISLGGETVDQAILDQVAATFPSASIRHIYASSEAGAAIVVTDAKAGFPVSRLTREDGALQLKVEDGKLFVRSPFTTAAAAGNPETWVDTGDLVEIRGDRVFFLGREGSSMINVGGMKAVRGEIEAQLLKHANVLWAQAYPRKAPFVGMLPAARIVLREPSSDPNHDQAELASFLREALPEHAIPRFWDFINEIPLKPSFKS